MLIGDFNARPGAHKQDIINDGNDGIQVPDTYIPDNTLNRTSCDDKVNKYGRKLLNICSSNQMRFLNGRCLGDFTGNYTCWQWNGASVVDYVIIQNDDFHKISWFQIHSPSH